MWAALVALVQAILPGIFGQVVGGVVEVQKARIASETDQARLDEELAARKVAADSAAATTNAQVVIAEQAHWITRMIRPAFALPLLVWWGQCIADKTVLTWFGIHHSTDDLGGTLHWIAVLVLTSYFGPIAYNSLRSR